MHILFLATYSINIFDCARIYEHVCVGALFKLSVSYFILDWIYVDKSNLCLFLCKITACLQNEAVSTLKKAKQQYFQRCDELEKAKAISAKAVDDTVGVKTLDKRRKSKDEARTKVNVFLMHCINKSHTLLFCLAPVVEHIHPGIVSISCDLYSVHLITHSCAGDGDRASLQTVCEWCQYPPRRVGEGQRKNNFSHSQTHLSRRHRAQRG